MPRNNGGVLVPPNPGDPGFIIVDTQPFRGPINITDQYFNENPMLTDNVITNPGQLPPLSLAVDGSPMNTATYAWTAHRWHGLLAGMNQASGTGT